MIIWSVVACNASFVCCLTQTLSVKEQVSEEKQIALSGWRLRRTVDKRDKNKLGSTAVSAHHCLVLSHYLPTLSGEKMLGSETDRSSVGCQIHRALTCLIFLLSADMLLTSPLKQTYQWISQENERRQTSVTTDLVEVCNVLYILRLITSVCTRMSGRYWSHCRNM